jgi:BirA family biotin operon repressor/biotin-[acetyl-CoA-carboxylase] ligase
MAPEQLLPFIECLRRAGSLTSAQLAAEAGASLAALHGARRGLARLGLRYAPVRDTWCWPAPAPPLDTAALAALALSAQAQLLGLEVHYAPLVGSTNDLAWARARARGCAQLVVAEGQWAGRGRRGRQWRSPLGAGLYVSIALPLPAGGEAAGLSLAVGVVLVESLTALGVPGLALKWPNDVVHARGKVGGILLELQHHGGERWLILGMGLNIHPLPEAGDQALALRALGLRRNREALLEAFVPALLAEAQQFFAAGLTPGLRDRYRALDAYRGAVVRAETQGQRWEGRYVGIDDAGLIVVETAQGMERLGHGEVTLRRLEDGQVRYG